MVSLIRRLRLTFWTLAMCLDFLITPLQIRGALAAACTFNVYIDQSGFNSNPSTASPPFIVVVGVFVCFFVCLGGLLEGLLVLLLLFFVCCLFLVFLFFVFYLFIYLNFFRGGGDFPPPKFPCNTRWKVCLRLLPFWSPQISFSTPNSTFFPIPYS